MAMVNYVEMEICLECRMAFEHGSAHARRVDNCYRVWSYNTLVLEYDLLYGEVTYFNSRKYSTTTSRLQNMIRRNFNVSGFDA